MRHLDRPDGTIECEDVIGCVVERREPYTGGVDMTPSQRNVRPREEVYPHEAPDPVRYGDTPSRTARYPIAVFQSVASWLAVSLEEFRADLWAPIHVASTTYRYGVNPQAVNPWGERANIQRGESRPYGSGFEVSADEQKLLLIGR